MAKLSLAQQSGAKGLVLAQVSYILFSNSVRRNVLSVATTRTASNPRDHERLSGFVGQFFVVDPRPCN